MNLDKAVMFVHLNVCLFVPSNFEKGVFNLPPNHTTLFEMIKKHFRFKLLLNTLNINFYLKFKMFASVSWSCCYFCVIIANEFKEKITMHGLGRQKREVYIPK